MQKTLRVPEGTHVQAPLQIENETSVLVVLERGSSATIVDDVRCSEDLTIELDEGARLEFISCQIAGASTKLTIRQRATLHDNAKIFWRNVTLGGHSVQHDLHTELVGAHAESEVDWIFYAKDEEQYRLTARNVFNGSSGGGEITMKGVAEEKAHVRCDGMIEIGKGGAQTNTYLTQNVLMLDKTAKVDAIPGLEIKTNDVKASHSATVSRVTDEDLFYFNSRGIPQREARRMFVEGFLGEILAGTAHASVQERISAFIGQKYEN